MTADPTPDSVNDEQRWRPQDDPDGLSREDVSPRDLPLYYLLSTTVGFDDDKEGSFGITMSLGGQVVSGLVISRKAWLERMQQLVRDEAGAEALADGLGMMGDTIATVTAENKARREALNLPPATRQFIHLRDVRVYLPGGDNLDVKLWRADLKHLTGWTLGSHNLKGE